MYVYNSPLFFRKRKLILKKTLEKQFAKGAHLFFSKIFRRGYQSVTLKIPPPLLKILVKNKGEGYLYRLGFSKVFLSKNFRF